MSYFRVTLVRSAIGLPRRTTDVLKALGLKKRMATVFHPVSPSVAGQIMKVKELVDVLHLERKPDPGYYIEQTSGAEWKAKRSQ
ncbi:ribosomal protein L30p/L7e-domain-containing protein [Aspergillus parasiticus]|uniref:Large ribosomal subunit protein uL30m n=2 Tax=Aspergillus subgen. Circumdati TaxID=2720871 RepID=A0A5N6DHS9_ASPPA|nr:ribosomal protein L30p/L7e-domain-containing protein [Aspergillus parasiticus]KAJ1708930.1 mitochondrial 54S ribosomal protein YmL33 [Aspergillus flavus]RAQ42391.1 mitochondrial 54S ribosomal protein YmL33 [Aspergillus flavus]RMZ40138.1 mitochondrial 54S ribosomal protein YmL33 [Aspergillus flavus]